PVPDMPVRKTRFTVGSIRIGLLFGPVARPPLGRAGDYWPTEYALTDIFLKEYIWTHAGHAERPRGTEPASDHRAPSPPAPGGRGDRCAAPAPAAAGLEASACSERCWARRGPSGGAAADLQPARGTVQRARRLAGALPPHGQRTIRSPRRHPSRAKRKGRERPWPQQVAPPRRSRCPRTRKS